MGLLSHGAPLGAAWTHSGDFGPLFLSNTGLDSFFFKLLKKSLRFWRAPWRESADSSTSFWRVVDLSTSDESSLIYEAVEVPAPSTAKLFTPCVLRSMGRELFRSIPLSSFFRVVMVRLPPRSPLFTRVPGTTGINDFDCFISSSSSFYYFAAASCSSVGAAEAACWIASAILTEPVSLG